MSTWPFDRLLRAIIPLCAEHQVFVQRGSSKVVPPCAGASFITFNELITRIDNADIIITHGGNTVRLVQRAGKIPIVIARTVLAHEAINDHQVEYLCHEASAGRAIAIWDMSLLSQAVGEHATIVAASRLHSLEPPAAPSHVATLLDTQWSHIIRNPFRHHPLRRYDYAWDELASRTGRHLDVGCGTAEFLNTLALTTELECHGCDPHIERLDQVHRTFPQLAVRFVSINGPLPYPDRYFDSVSLLDVLEHCPNEDDILDEIRRVLRPDGLLILTVPKRHFFSCLDPNNIKFRFPRLHRVIYSLRFGRDVYRKRFVDDTDDLIGDMSLGKREHTNYRRDWLVDRVRQHGFVVTRESGANLFWRLFQVPALFVGPRFSQPFDFAIWLDGQFFSHANLFLSAKVPP